MGILGCSFHLATLAAPCQLKISGKIEISIFKIEERRMPIFFGYLKKTPESDFPFRYEKKKSPLERKVQMNSRRNDGNVSLCSVLFTILSVSLSTSPPFVFLFAYFDIFEACLPVHVFKPFYLDTVFELVFTFLPCYLFSVFVFTRFDFLTKSQYVVSFNPALTYPHSVILLVVQF